MIQTTPIVLVASADDCARQLSTLVLSQAGVRVEGAQSGEQALRQADRLRPAAVLADMAMPDIDGVTVRERLRACSATRTIPLLVVKGSPDTWLEALAILTRVLDWGRNPSTTPIGN